MKNIFDGNEMSRLEVRFTKTARDMGEYVEQLQAAYILECEERAQAEVAAAVATERTTPSAATQAAARLALKALFLAGR